MPKTYPTKARIPSAKRRLEFGDDDQSKKNNQSSTPIVATISSVEVNANVNANVVMGTPVKKKRRREEGVITGYFSSPTKTIVAEEKKAALVTPEKDESQQPQPPQQQPQPQPQPQAAQPIGGGGSSSSSTHVPKYIHKNLDYKRRGTAVLSETMKTVFWLVEEHCGIPDNFENDRKYGPLSGTCFEERLVRAYDTGKLRPADPSVEICTQCAELGHGRDDCPQLI